MKPSIYSRIKDLSDPRDLRALKIGLVVGIAADLGIAAAIALQTPAPHRATDAIPPASCGLSCAPADTAFPIPSAEVAGAGGKAL